MQLGKTAAVLLILLALSSCRFDYGEDRPGEAIEDPPDFILHRMTYDVRLSDGSRITFSGDTGEFRDREQEAKLKQAVFSQYDREGELLTVGTADEGIIDLNTEDALLIGNVEIEAVQEGMTFTAPRLSWEREAQRLTSAPEDIVTLTESDGTIIMGRGFTGDLYRRTFLFAKDVEGELHEAP